MQRKLWRAIFCYLPEDPSPPLRPRFTCFLPSQPLVWGWVVGPSRKFQQFRFLRPISSCSDSKPRSVSSSDTDYLGQKSPVGIGKSVISMCSYLWEKKADTFVGESSLQDILKVYGDLSPQSTRRFWRVSTLSAADFLEILLQSLESGDLSLRQVEFLLKLFRWTQKQSADFYHLPKSYEVLVSVLIRAQMYEDAESLLLEVEPGEIFSSCAPLFSDIIRGYAERCKSDKSVALFDSARGRGVIPSVSTYQVLLHLLNKIKKVELVIKVYMDMVEVGLASPVEESILNTVVRALTEDKTTLEAITLLRKLKSFVIQPSRFAVSVIAEGLCKKKDYDDMFGLMDEYGLVPEVNICNKLVSSLCTDLGTQEAWSFVQKLELLGFKPDVITFSILACHSCRTRKLKNGFVFLFECLSRGLAPNTHIYNALISGIFKEGFHGYAKDIFEDMLEKGAVPDETTFRILLAGYCKHKKFDRIKEIIADMRERYLISLASFEDPLSKALTFLGLDHLEVKIKRDNNVGIPRSEFFDCLGNGLYLDTDIEEYETSLAQILDCAIIPNFGSMLMRKVDNVDMQAALRVKDELLQWGQNHSLSIFSKLFRHLCATRGQLNEAINFLNDMPELIEQLDGETLNLLLQKLSKNGRIDIAMLILKRLFNRNLMLESQSFIALVGGLYKERNVGGLKECFNLAQRSMWLPDFKDIGPLFSCLCKWGLIREVLELLDRMLEKHPEILYSLGISLVKQLCMTGYTNVGCILIQELLQRNIAMSHAPYLYLSMGFLKEKHFVESLGMLDILINKNQPLPIEICQNFIPILLRFNRVEEAIALKQSVLANKRDNGVVIYSALLSELCRTRKVNVALSHLQEMMLIGMLPDNNALNALLQMCCLENNLRRACELLGFLVRLYGSLSIPGYRSLMHQMLTNGLISRALRLKDLIQSKDKSIELSLYNILIFHLFQTGNSSYVGTLIKDIHGKHIYADKNTYDFLVRGFYKCGEALKSVEAFNMIISKGWRPSNRSLRIVMCYLCNDGKLEKALELCKVMERNNWMLSSVIQDAVAGALLRYCGLSEAELFLDRVNKRGLIPRGIDYNNLIQQFRVHAGMKKAVDLLNVMLQKGNCPSEISYSSVIHGLCLHKDFDQALDFWVEMMNKNLQPTEESCYALVTNLCAYGRTDDARTILRTMFQFGPTPTYSMYNHVLNNYYLNKDLDKASDLLREMQQAGYSPNFETHWSLISSLSSLEKKNDDDCNGILSGLLSRNNLPTKNFKKKGVSIFMHEPS